MSGLQIQCAVSWHCSSIHSCVYINGIIIIIEGLSLCKSDKPSIIIIIICVGGSVYREHLQVAMPACGVCAAW